MDMEGDGDCLAAAGGHRGWLPDGRAPIGGNCRQAADPEGGSIHVRKDGGSRVRVRRFLFILAIWSAMVASAVHTSSFFQLAGGSDLSDSPNLGDGMPAPFGSGDSFARGARGAAAPMDEAEAVNATDHFDAKPAPAAVDRNATSKLERVLVIATVPLDFAHTLALWTHLECLTDEIDRVVVAAPDVEWSRGIIEMIVFMFTSALAEAGRRRLDVEASFHVNNRYDVGLWCDGLTYHLGYDGERYANFIRNGTKAAEDVSIFLVNDSAMTLRRYDGLTKKLVRFAAHETAMRRRNESATSVGVKLVGMNGLLRRDHRGVRNGRPGGGGFYWVESMYRGLTPLGVSRFYGHSCRNMYVPGTMPCRFAGDFKKCIVARHEQGLADTFRWEEVDAMYPSFRPKDWDTRPWEQSKGGTATGWEVALYPKNQWIKGGNYFLYLVEEHGFPMRKVSKGKGLGAGECASLLKDREWMERLPFPSLSMQRDYWQDMKKSREAL